MIGLGQALAVHVQNDVGRHTHLVIQVIGGSQQYRHAALIKEVDLVQIPQRDQGYAIQQLLFLHLVDDRKKHIVDSCLLLGIGICRRICIGLPGGSGSLGSLGCSGGECTVRCQAQVGARRQLRVRPHPGIQENESLRPGCLRAKHLEPIAEHQPSGSSFQSKALGGRLHLDDHRAGHLDIHLDHIQVGQLRLQLF